MRTEPIETSVELYKENTPVDFNALVTNKSIISSNNVTTPREPTINSTNVTAEGEV